MIQKYGFFFVRKGTQNFLIQELKANQKIFKQPDNFLRKIGGYLTFRANERMLLNP
jgi:hypothetical protein